MHECVWVAGTLALLVSSGRDMDNIRDATSIAVRPSSGMVSLESTSRNRSGLVHHVEQQHPIGEVTREAEEASAVASSSSPKSEGGKEVHSSPGVRLKSDERGTDTTQEASKLDASVKDAIKALIKSRPSKPSGVTLQSPVTRKLPDNGVQVKLKSGADFPGRVLNIQQTAPSAEALVQGSDNQHGPKNHSIGLVSREQTGAVDEKIGEVVPENNSNAEDANETDAFEEDVLSTSAAPPNAVVEQIERDSMSVLSVVFFTYFLLCLAALAACTAYLTYSQDAEDYSVKEKWKHTLAYLYAPGGAIERSRVGRKGQQQQMPQASLTPLHTLADNHASGQHNPHYGSIGETYQ